MAEIEYAEGRFVATRYVTRNGSVIRHVFGPFKNDYYARRFITAQKADRTEWELKRSEFSVHKALKPLDSEGGL